MSKHPIESAGSEALYRQVVESIEDFAIIPMDPRGLIIGWNAGAERLFGYSRDEVLGRPCALLLAPEEQERRTAEQALETARAEGRAADERWHLRKDGGRFWGSERVTALRDAEGRLLGFAKVVRDCPPRKKLEETTLALAREEAARTEAEAAHRRIEALLESTPSDLRDAGKRERAESEERRLGAILEATPDLVGTFDTEGRLRYLNSAGRRMLGMVEESPTRWSLLGIHPEWAASLVRYEGIPGALRDGTWSGDTAVVDRSGRELPTSQVIIAHRQPDGTVEYLSTIMRTMAERKQMEEMQHFLSEAGRTLAGMLEHQAIFDCLTRLAVPRLADCCIVYAVEKQTDVRPVAAVRRGEAGQELLRRLRGLPPETHRRSGVSRVMRAVMPERVGEVTLAWLRAHSGSEEHFLLLRELALTSVMLVPICVRERVLGVLFLASERRERRYGPADVALAEELASRAGLAIEGARLYQESQRATRARDEVLAIVSHDLRNPLSTISMSGKLLLARLPRELVRERKQLEVIQRSAGRMNRLIQDLLDVARMEAGRLTVERRREEVRPLIHDALEQQRTLAEQKGLRLREAVAEPLPEVEVDRERLLQALQNLLGNALRFTPEGGIISLSAWQAGPEVYFSVADTGPGIAGESLPHLFEPYWQAGRTEGAGLGLAIVKGIVEAHGGRIWVESRLGEGTAFIFSVPVLSGAAAGAPPPPP